MKKMKTLSNYCVEVKTNFERKVAVSFFRKASKRPMDGLCLSGKLVGMSNRKVATGIVASPWETIIPFDDISKLADTASRSLALRRAFKQYSPTQKVNKTDVHRFPLVIFSYPHSDTGCELNRYVKVINCDDEYLTGYEVPSPEANLKGKFKKFKLDKINGAGARLLKFVD